MGLPQKYVTKSDDPKNKGYERCPFCDHACSVGEFIKGPDGMIHCNHCRVQDKN